MMAEITIKHMHKEVKALKKEVTMIKSFLNKENEEKKKLRSRRISDINKPLIKLWDNEYDEAWNNA